MQFANPMFLVAGAVACTVLIWLEVRRRRARQRDLDRLVAANLQDALLANVSRRKRNTKDVLRLLAVACIFLALARPQAGYQWQEVPRRGIDVLLALDTSRSMLAKDVAPNRLERAKMGVLDFLEHVQGDRVGLLPFAGNAFLTCPLTLDHDAFRQSLQAVDTDVIPEVGTDVAAAIRTAHKALSEDDVNNKILVLITDGEDLEGEALEAARHAAENGVVIHTVGVGTPAGERVPILNDDGSVRFARDEKGNVVRSCLDEQSLKKIATAAGGRYEPLGRRGEGLLAIHREALAPLNKHDLSERRHKIPLEQFAWPLGLAALLLLLEYLMGDRRRRSRRLSLIPRKAVAAATLLVLTGLAAPLAAQEPPRQAAAAPMPMPEDPRVRFNQGREHYLAGRFEDAERVFRTALATDDLDLHGEVYYSLGNTLFRQGEATKTDPSATIQKWEEAIRQYDAALRLHPDDADAKFNREVVLRKLEELKRKEEETKKQQQNQQQQQQQQQQNQEQQQQQPPQQQQQQDQQQNGQGQDQKGQDQKNQDQKAQDQKGQDQKGQDQKGQDQKGQDQKGQDQKGQDQKGQDQKGQDEQAAADPKGERKKDPEEKPGDGDPVARNQMQKQREQRASDDAAAKPGVMSRRQAVRLLDSLKEGEGRLDFVPVRRQGQKNNHKRGRDW